MHFLAKSSLEAASVSFFHHFTVELIIACARIQRFFPSSFRSALLLLLFLLWLHKQIFCAGAVMSNRN